jgi:galactokinase
MNGQTLRNYPLPMKGLLILSVHVRRGTRFPRVNTLEKELRRLRNSHPMVFSYGDITPDMVNTVEYNYLPYIASENVRIDEACNALKNCSITEFAKIVNDSAHATAEYLNTSEEQNFLTRIAPNIEGCLCAHAAANGIYSIVEAGLTDYIIGKISDKFEDCFGYKPQFAVTKAS